MGNAATMCDKRDPTQDDTLNEIGIKKKQSKRTKSKKLGKVNENQLRSYPFLEGMDEEECLLV